jgi:hypothetical protein
LCPYPQIASIAAGDINAWQSFCETPNIPTQSVIAWPERRKADGDDAIRSCRGKSLTRCPSGFGVPATFTAPRRQRVQRNSRSQ